MTKNAKGSGQKHFQREDHDHAAHQEQAKRGNGSKASGVDKNMDERRTAATGHPIEKTPRGPMKGQ